MSNKPAQRKCCKDNIMLSTVALYPVGKQLTSEGNIVSTIRCIGTTLNSDRLMTVGIASDQTIQFRTSSVSPQRP